MFQQYETHKECAGIGCDDCYKTGTVPRPITADTKGIVVFYEPDYATKSIKEIGRTPEMPFFTALDYYAETPNPASQLIRYDNIFEKKLVLAELETAINNREWLDQLFECI